MQSLYLGTSTHQAIGKRGAPWARPSPSWPVHSVAEHCCGAVAGECCGGLRSILARSRLARANSTWAPLGLALFADLWHCLELGQMYAVP